MQVCQVEQKAMTDQKLPRKKLMLSFLILQFSLGCIFLFNAIPFDYILRIFGLGLIISSPLWLVIFKITRIEKTKEIDKKTDTEEKKKLDEEV